MEPNSRCFVKTFFVGPRVHSLKKKPIQSYKADLGWKPTLDLSSKDLFTQHMRSAKGVGGRQIQAADPAKGSAKWPDGASIHTRRGGSTRRTALHP